ncbi:MAG TPA: fimbria/pilus outer membrane usher protein [Verrucomicrobiae bacterium]|nr:fimbria/pilus outer membrane usher protein [Verrucomicrobiae bacterium]
MADPVARPASLALRLAYRVVLALAVCSGSARATQEPTRPADVPGDSCSATAAEAAPAYVPRLLRVTVNGINTRQEYLFLQRRCGALLARRQDMEALRVKTAGAPTVEINGDPYLNLNRYPKLVYVLDESGQALEIDGEPEIFYPTVINLEQDRLAATGPVLPGGFLNYGLFTNDRVEGGNRGFTGSATLGVFGEPGVLVSDWLGYKFDTVERVVRLGTTFFRDYPERISTLRIGDVYSRGGAFGGSASLGGVQYGTNFSTRPYLITTPVEMMEAATRRMAVVNLFNAEFDDPERQSRAAFLSGIATAPHGPVEILNIPTYQNGEYVLTLRDQLGREYTVRQAFFFNQGLLRQGLHDFSYEAGARRLRGDRDEYGDAFAAATHRYGFSTRFTGEGHAEVTEDIQALGATGSLVVPRVGVLSASLAGSHAGGAGSGLYGALTLENRYRDTGYAARTECRSESFFRASEDPAVGDPLMCRGFASVSYALTPFDSVAVSAAGATLRGAAADSLGYRLGYVTRRWPGLNLTAFVGLTEQPQRDESFGVLASASFATLRDWAGAPASRPQPASLLDPRRVQGNLAVEGGRHRQVNARARVSSNARVGEHDFGVQAGTSLGGAALQTLSGSWSNRYLVSSVGVSHTDSDDYYTAGGASGLVYMDGGLYPARPLTGSFAVVKLGPEHAGVRVNSYRADADGDVLVSPMQPHRENPVVINGADLPMNARFDGLNLAATPRFRSGVILRPGIRVLRDALLTVQLRGADGAVVPLPPGGYATLPESDELFPVGEAGALYVIGLQAATKVTVHWNNQQCTLDIALSGAPPVDAIPELGPYVCEGIAP